VLVVYDGSAAARRALAAAVQLVRPDGRAGARGRDGRLTVFVLADTFEAAQDLQDQIAEWLRGQEMDVRYRWLPGANALTLAHAVRAEGSGTLVLPARSVWLAGEALTALLNEIECPVLLVR
jgi:nucleotide-binding universal stress UspA family protein